jgi:hypothetical protein
MSSIVFSTPSAVYTTLTPSINIADPNSTSNIFLNELLKNNLTKSQPLVIVDKYKNTSLLSVDPITQGIFSTTLNDDKNTHNTVSKYFLYKILDNWLYDELLPLLAFVKITDDKPHLITNLNDFDVNSLTKSSKKDIETRIDYLEKILINKQFVKHVLKKVVSKYNISWTSLKEYKKDVIKYFYNYIKDKLKKAIEG